MHFRNRLLALANIKRIHIIGCSRSGTTMLHAAMCAFDRVVLCPDETDAAYSPTLKEALGLAVTRPRHCYVTKRDYGWFKHPAILAHDLVANSIGVISITRDPRDVLVSGHANAGEGYYVSPDMWKRSIEAGEIIMTAVRDHVPAIEVRYENLVCEPNSEALKIAAAFDLNIRPGVSMGAIRGNLEAGPNSISGAMATAMHGIRNMSPSSIGGWRRDPEKKEYVERLVAEGVIESC